MAKATPKPVPTPSAPPRRAMWILNHATLMPAEVPALRALGIEVYTPKKVPNGDKYGGNVVTEEYDAGLRMDAADLKAMNQVNFYEDVWPDEIAEIINRNFQFIITSVYATPLRESLSKFKGTIVARVFGVVRHASYDDAIREQDVHLPALIRSVGDRFIFGQAYPHLAGIEPNYLRSRRATAGVGLPARVWSKRNSWIGDGTPNPFVLLLMPRINDNPYYTETYKELKRLFAQLPYKMFGRQFSAVDDPAVLPYMTDDELIRLYQVSPVFAYHATEPRHVHYSPIEAMAIGAPVLYRAGGMIDFLAGRILPGRCETGQDLADKSEAIINGDLELADAVRESQADILEYFLPATVISQWAKVLGVPEPAGIAPGMTRPERLASAGVSL